MSERSHHGATSRSLFNRDMCSEEQLSFPMYLASCCSDQVDVLESIDVVMNDIPPTVFWNMHDHFGGGSVLVWARIRRDGCTALLSRGSFHKAIVATIDLNYLRLILRLPALIFTSVPRNNFKTIINPAHVEKKILFHLTG